MTMAGIMGQTVNFAKEFSRIMVLCEQGITVASNYKASSDDKDSLCERTARLPKRKAGSVCWRFIPSE